MLINGEIVYDSEGLHKKNKPCFPGFPKNYHMQWLREHISNEEIRINFHYDNSDKKYLADFISLKEAITPYTSNQYFEIEYPTQDSNSKQWTPKKPVIISVQTGKGKNHFTFKKLLKKLIEQFPNEGDHILFLNNRVATNRQDKIQVAKELVALIPTNEYKHKIEEIYTSKGIDECCVDFGVITICTYHQMYERELLRKKHFRYIICDECHFFTSDSIFNPETNNILKEIVTKGKDSIRVYMSATIEVAFEPIIREEFKKIEKERDSVISKMQQENYEHMTRVYEETDFSNDKTYALYLMIINNDETLSNRQTIDRYNRMLWERRWGIINPYSEEEIKKVYDSYFLEIDFYYMPRNYDYIEKIISYKTDEELVDHIQNSKEKWIIFVHSENGGKHIKDKLMEKGTVNTDECIFISRSTIELEGSEKAEAEYDFIVANETTKKRIIITTCILDNGINIKNSTDGKQKNKILNIAIDSNDRTQFIQMLGRIRDNQKDKIKLYIKEYSLEDLKRNISRDAEGLIKRLVNPLHSTKEKQRNFDKELFYFTDNPETFSTYNPCAIYQLIDQMTRTLRIIRKNDKNFFIKVSDNLDALKEKLYHYYMNFPPDTPEVQYIRSTWERSIIELFETEIHHKTIEDYIKEDIKNGIDPIMYYPTLNDTFTRFLFSDMIPQHFLSIISFKYENYIEKLNTSDLNYYNAMVERKLGENSTNGKSKYYTKAIYLYQKCEILKDLFPDEYQDLSIDFIKDYAEKIKHYENLADDNKFTSFLDEQLRWIEKYSDDLTIETQITIDSNLSLNEFIQSCAITMKELENNIHRKYDGTNSNYINEKFLSEHGILKDSDKANELSTTYFNGCELSNCLNKKITIENIPYTLISRNSNANGHKTYYLFIKSE